MKTNKTSHFCDISATEVFVAYLARVRIISSVSPVKYLPQNWPFWLKTSETSHFSDVSATELFVAYLACVRIISSVSPVKYLLQKCHFRSKQLKQAIYVMF